MKKQERQPIVDPAKIAAGGIASPLAALLTSRFGVAGTLLGLALTAVVITTITDILKVYLARAPTKMGKIPSSFRTRFSLQNLRGGPGAPFSWFLSLPPARRRAILVSGIVAGVISFVIGMTAVTGLELGVGKSLSCWIWNECPTESSSEDSEASTTSTLPSILGGGQSASNNAPEVKSLNPQQQPGPGSRGASLQPQGVPGSQTPTSSASGQRWSPSGVPEDQQQNSSVLPEEEQRPSGSPEDRKQSEDQQRSSVNNPEDQPQKDQQQENPTSPLFTT